MPTPYTEAELKAVLDGLGNLTPDGIADRVAATVGTGKAECQNPQGCAVALYVAKVLDVQAPWYIEIGTWGSYLIDDRDGVELYVENPESVSKFIGQFDKGFYPSLVTPDSLAKVLERERRKESSLI